jgi:hypothetical protein
MLLRIELGRTPLKIPASETTWELELEWVVEGVDEVGGVSSICDEEISRAGLGNVLYVEPKEVYLDIEEISLLVFWWLIGRTKEPLPLII